MAGINVASLFVGVSANTSPAQDSLSAFGARLRSIGRELEATGAGLTTTVGAPLAAVGGTVIKLGADFEHALNRVRKTTGLTADDTKVLGKGLLDLSASTAGGAQSAEQLAAIAEVAGQLGIDGADNILNFTRVIAQFSLATGIAGDQAAAQLEAFRQLTQLPPGNLENVSSTIVDLGNKTAATEAQIIEFANRLAGALHTSGATAQQILGISATLASLQIDPEAGGTAISKFFIDMTAAASGTGAATKDVSAKTRELQERLSDLSANLRVAQDRQTQFGRNTPAASVQQNADAIARYQREIADTQSDLAKLNTTQQSAKGSAQAFAAVAGLTVEQFQQLVKTNPTQAFQRIIEGIARIRETQGPGAAFAALENIGVDDTRQRDAILRLSTATDALKNNLDTANTAFDNNTAAADENAAAMQDTTNKFNLLLNQIKRTIIEGWDLLRPAVLASMDAFRTNVLPVLESARTTFADLPEPVRNFAIALGVLLIVLGPVLVALGLMFAAIGVISLPVLAVAAVIGILAAAWISNLGDIQGKTQQVMGILGALFATARKFWEDNSPGFVTAVEGVLSAVMTIVGRLYSVWGTVVVFLVTVADRALREIGTFFDTYLRAPIEGIASFIGEKVGGAILGLLKLIQTIVNATGISGALGGLDINETIRQGELALQGLSKDIAAGGPGQANNIVVNLNNPQVPDQTAGERFAQIVQEQIVAAITQSTNVVEPPPVAPVLPGRSLQPQAF